MVLGHIIKSSVLFVPEYVGWYWMRLCPVARNKFHFWRKNAGQLESVFLCIPKYNGQPGFGLAMWQSVMSADMRVDNTFDAENN